MVTDSLSYGENCKDNSGKTFMLHVVHKTVTAVYHFKHQELKDYSTLMYVVKDNKETALLESITVLVVIVYSGQYTESLCTTINVYNNNVTKKKKQETDKQREGDGEDDSEEKWKKNKI